jgi:cytochrome P450
MSTSERAVKAEVRHEGRCPVVPGYDPMTQAGVADPHPWIDAARKEVPVFYVPEYDEWVITRFAELVEMYQDNESYSMVAGLDFPVPPPEIAAAQPDGRWAIASFLERADPPQHSKTRRLYAPAFSLKQAMLKTEWIRELTHRLVDEFIDEGSADLVHVYNNNIPVAVICNVLGVPEADAPQVYRWAVSVIDLFSNPLEGEELLALGRDVLALENYVTDLVEDRRLHLTEDDFVSKLLTARLDDEGTQIDTRTVVGMICDLIFAGSDTSASALGLIEHRLLGERSLWEGLLADRDSLEAAVEEGLRTCNPARGASRRTTRDVQVGEITIPKGSTVRAHTWAAGFDEREFPDPLSFEVDRPNVRKHITFGRGIHQCPGANIARREIFLGLETLLDRLPSLRLVPGHELTYVPNLMTPTLLGGVVCEWDERSAG